MSRRRTESPTDLRASARRQTDTLLDQNLREAASVRAPGIGGQPLMSAAGVRLTTYAWNLTSPTPDLVAPELRGDRFGLTASVPPLGGHMLTASFYNDTVQFGDSHQGARGLGSAGFVLLRSGEFSPGLSAGLLCLGGLTVGLSLAFKVVGRGHTRVIATHHDKMLVEQHARRALGPQTSFGVGLSLVGLLPWVGLVGRAAYLRGQTKTLISWTTPDALLDMESSGLRHPGAIAWGLQRPVLPWPEPALQSNGWALPQLQVGERFARTLDTSGKHGSAIALFGVLSGSYRAWENRLEVTADRPDATTLRIALINDRARATTYAVEVPILADAERTHLHSQAVEQAFEFDMSLPQARAAAASLWAGNLPEGAWAATMEPPDPHWLVGLRDYDNLPPGVTRSRIAWLKRPHEDHGGVAAGLPWYTPRWLRAGREQDRRTSLDCCLGWFGGEVRLNHRWQTSVRTQRYHSDERTRTVAANHAQVLTGDGAQPGRTQVTIQWRYGRFGSRAQARAIAWLNRSMLADAPLPPFPTDYPAGPYTLEVTREAPSRVAYTQWHASEVCLAKELGAPASFVDLCAHLRTQGDEAMPWLHAHSEGSAADLCITPSLPNLETQTSAAQATQKLNEQRLSKAPLMEQATRLENARRQRTALERSLAALQADPIAQRFGGAAWRRAMLATECAITATTAPTGAVGRLDTQLDALWGA